MTVRDWIDLAAARLREAGVDSPKLDAEVLAAHVLDVERVWLVAHPEAEFPDLAGEALLQRRERREPLAYIVGWREFYGRRFFVRPGVLIPRQETEVLVDAALHFADEGPILDIGTGSGCIAVTIKLENPYVSVTAVDVSPEALAVARSNAVTHEADVRFVESNLFSALGDAKFEVIVSNPPYIADQEELMPEVGEYEPATALFAGPTGLEFYERLATEAIGHLTERGRLVMEVGYTQAAGVIGLFKERGWFHEWTAEDLSGNDRVIAVSRSGE